MNRQRALLLALGFAGAFPLHAQDIPLYRDSTRSVDRRVEDLLGRMTKEEKFWQLFMIPGDLDQPGQDYSHGIFGLQIAPSGTATGPAAARAHAERINDVQRYFVEQTRLGIPIIPFDEGVHGVVREGGTMFPQAIGLAATFDTGLMTQVAGAIAEESRSRGIRQILAPVINLATDVRWGRTEETYGEDPWLSAALAVAYSRALERHGVVATPKHFVANVGEGGRDSYPIGAGPRRLEEYEFRPFRAAVEDGGAGSVMSAYNSVGGTPASQNGWLLTSVLRGEWRFRGFVISDAAATGGATVLHNTEPDTPHAARDAFEAGLDVVFQSSWPQYRPYWKAFESGLIADSVIDRAVRRVLRAKFELGLFEHPYVDPADAGALNGSEAHRALARRAAEEGIVLLENRGGLLPLRGDLASIAVIGPDAREGRLGGYSGPGTTMVSILHGIRARAGKSAVHYAEGVSRIDTEYVVVPAAALSHLAQGRLQPGLQAQFFDNPALSGPAITSRVDSVVDFGWTLSAPTDRLDSDWYSARWSGNLTVPAGGVRRIGVMGTEGYRLYLDGRLIVDRWNKVSAGEALAAVDLPARSKHAFRLEYRETIGNAHLKLVWDAGVRRDWRSRIDAAVATARRSRVAIVVAGIEEGEFRDRSKLGLPGHQGELIRRVVATGTPTVVVLVGGSAITMPEWGDRVGAILDAWYPGTEGGNAVARVLFGDVDPSGRLPITFPAAEGQVPLVYDHQPTGRGDDYLDGSGLGAYPFGYGLSYTTFEYADLSIEPAQMEPGDSATVSLLVRNTGARAGDEVVQLYIRDLLATVAQPVEALKGAVRIHLAPGESRRVTFALGPRELALLDRDMHWSVEPGEFRVMVGASSRDIRLRGGLVVTEPGR